MNAQKLGSLVGDLQSKLHRIEETTDRIAFTTDDDVSIRDYDEETCGNISNELIMIRTQIPIALRELKKKNKK